MKKFLLLACLVFLPRFASATVLSETSSTTYVCSGAATYSIPWSFLEKGHIVVTRWLTATPAVVTTLVQDAGTSPSYTVTMYNNGLTGLVTLTNGTTCATNYTLKVTRQLPVTQEISFRSQGTFLPSFHEYMADKLTMLLQQVQAGISQSADTATAISNHIGSADDHTGYFLLAGRSGGQNARGGTDPGDDLTLSSTNNGTKGNIHLGANSTYDEVNKRLGLNDTSPSYTLDVNGVGRFVGALYAQATLYGSLSTGGDLTLKGNSAAANGHIYFGTASAYDEANDKFLLGTLTEDSLFTGELEVTTAALVPDIYGETASGGDLKLHSTTHATKGKIYFGAASYFDENLGDLILLDDLLVTDIATIGGDLVAQGGLYGSIADGGDLDISSTTHGNKGNINIGAASTYDETVGAERLGIGTLAPATTLEVAGPVTISGANDLLMVNAGADIDLGGDIMVGDDAIVEDTIFGGDGSGDDLILRATTHATHGSVFIGENSEWELRALAGNDLIYTVNTYHQNVASDATHPVLELANTEGTSSAVPLRLAGGDSTPVATGDIVWVDLYASDRVTAISTIEYLLGGVGAQFTAASDRRLKKNIEDTSVHGLGVINGLRLRQFDFIDGRVPHVDIGFVAQEVLDVYPNMTSVDAKTGMYKVGDGALVPVLVKAIQELSAQVESQQQQIDALLELIEENQQ